MQFKKLAFFTILSLILFTGCDSKTSEENQTQEQSNTFKLTTNDAKTINIEAIENGMIFKEYAGKAVLLNFFATWCPPCRAEIPHLNNLREKYGKDFEIIAVLLEEGKSTLDIQEFIDEYSIQYPITNSNENFAIAQAVGGVRSIPTMFMYNKEGKLIEKYVGVVPEEMMETDIKRAIK